MSKFSVPEKIWAKKMLAPKKTLPPKFVCPQNSLLQKYFDPKKLCPQIFLLGQIFWGVKYLSCQFLFLPLFYSSRLVFNILERNDFYLKPFGYFPGWGGLLGRVIIRQAQFNCYYNCLLELSLAIE